jgi:glycosyltransferase involved in cell wall biosynthesis
MPVATNRCSISIFFPAFNDEGTIAGLVRNALDLLPSLTGDYQVLVINDGSTDGTAAIIDELAATHPQVRAIHHDRNRGYGGALQTGFKESEKELVFYTDGDGQYDVRELTRLLPLMVEGVAVVNGYKARRADGPARKILGGIYNRAARFLFNLPVRDVDCDFRLIRRSALQELGELSNSGAVCVELIRGLHTRGAVFAEVEVNHYPRLHGRSQFLTLARVMRTLYDFCALWIKLVCRPKFSKSKESETISPGKFSVTSR